MWRSFELRRKRAARNTPRSYFFPVAAPTTLFLFRGLGHRKPVSDDSLCLRFCLMKNYPPSSTPHASLRLLATVFSLCFALVLALAPTAMRAADAGVISGSISNAASGNMLEGARVELPKLGRTAFTDNTGRYVLTGLPSGAHEITVTYIGLDTVRGVVNIAGTDRATRDFELTSGVYKLEAFKVTGEREGSAAAITEKRNADNVKDVVAMDSFGNLPNMSAGEVVMRLPGVAGSPTDEGLNYKFNMRGMGPDMNTVTVDGGLMTSLGTTRSFEMQSITGTMFEALELIKGHTPDKGADSLGGTVNLKTRSPLSMREKRRTTYSVTMRSAPSFFEQTPLREKHRNHPLLTLAHQEVFDVLGGHKNLGVALNVFYSENAVGGVGTTLDYQNTMSPTAYIWDYRAWENINNRKQTSVNLKADYRWSPTTKFSVTLTGTTTSSGIAAAWKCARLRATRRQCRMRRRRAWCRGSLPTNARWSVR